MATERQNYVKAKSESNQRASTKARYGNEVAELLEQEPNDDWRDVQEFAQYVDANDY
jgi:hypothetical protein